MIHQRQAPRATGVFKSDRQFFIDLALDIIMDVSTPWTPLLDGNVCAVSHLYQLAQDDSPNSISDTPWAKKTLKAELAKTPVAQEALWESIVALWRLNLTMQKTSENTGWRTDWCNLVSAWLVCIHRLMIAAETNDVRISQQRHRDICWQFNATPYKVVLDFANKLRTDESLDVKIPSWDKPISVSSSEPEQVPKQIRNLRSSNQRSGARKTASNARGNRDVEIVELAPPTTRSAQKRKQRAQSDDDVLIDVGGSQMAQSDTKHVTWQTKLQEPPQVQKRSKQPQAKVVRARREEGLDLGLWQVVDETVISPLVPMANGMVGFASR